MEQVTLLEHYARSPWFGDRSRAGANQSILDGGESAAAAGPAALVANVIRSLSG